MKKFYVIFLFVFIQVTILAQNPEWFNFTNGQKIQSLADEVGYLWIGTTGGLVKINKTSGETIFFDKLKSALPDNNVLSLVTDVSGNIWIGTSAGGLAKFDGTNWTVYNSSNSDCAYKENPLRLF